MPTPSPNLNLDVDALFDHMIKNLGHQLDEEKDWHFSFRSTDLAKLDRIGQELSKEFSVDLQEEVETHENGTVFMGPPLLSVVVRGALDVGQVKALARRFTDLAVAEQVTYDGVSCYDLMDEAEFSDWLDLEQAKERLVELTKAGLPPGAPLPYIFAIGATDLQEAETIATACKADGYDDVEIVEDGDEVGVVIHTMGENDDEYLTKEYDRVEQIAKETNGDFLGVQFGVEEDGADSDDEDDDEGESWKSN